MSTKEERLLKLREMVLRCPPPTLLHDPLWAIAQKPLPTNLQPAKLSTKYDMSTKEQVLSRCKAVVESGSACLESGVHVYEHDSNDGTYYELCYDGGKLCINADGTGEGFDAAARWLKLDNPWRLTSEELPPINKNVLVEFVPKYNQVAYISRKGIWRRGCDAEVLVETPSRWRYYD